MRYTAFINKNFIIYSAIALLCAPAALAEAPKTSKLTLNMALATAYQQNPDLQAARATLRSTDENYAQARAGFKPTISGVADYTSNHAEYDSLKNNSDPKTLSLTMNQSLYSGGSTLADTRAAQHQIKAERANLHFTEQKILLDAVTAYMNLLRDEKIVELNTSNENVLKNYLKAANERFKLGDITKTDVSQAEARLAGATAGRVNAEGQVKQSRATFEQVIGLPPLGLEKPTWSIKLPASEEEALDYGIKYNPSLAAAKFSEEATRAQTRSIEGENLPQINLTGSLAKIYDPATVSTDEGNTTSVGLRATLPLYAGGGTSSRIRQSKQTENQRRMNSLSAERAVRQSVIDAWQSYTAAVAETVALRAQVAAAKLALDGVRVEADYGSRTTLDLLDAEQEHLNAQVSQVVAETKKTIAAYTILSAIGQLTAQNLQLDGDIYDPLENFQNVSGLLQFPKPVIFKKDEK